MNAIRLARAALVVALALISVVGPAWAQRREREEDPADREAAFYAMRAYPFGAIPQNARLDALLYSRWKIEPYGGSRSTAGANDWKPIGPFDMGGRVTSIALHPTDGATLWVGAAAGGVWKSTDRGASWRPVMDFENAITMGAIAVDPRNPAVLYAGTGEAATNEDSYGGAGIFKSTDGGATWHGSGLATTAAFARIVVHPANSSIVFAAAIKNNAGLYRSADAGRTWTRIVATGVSDITINPSRPDEMWIGSGPAGVMHSTDAGLTFTPYGTGIGTGGASVGRVSVQVAPSMPGVLYALADETKLGQGSFSRIYKSTNGGATWRIVLDNDPNILGYHGVAQGEYNNVIAVAPDDPNTVIAGGVVIARSTDGGDSWNVIDDALHLDHHALAFDPTDPARLYAGNDGGMYRSEDAGLSYDRITSGLAITQFYALAIDQQRANLTYGGTQDNGTITTEATEYRVGGPGVVGGGDGFSIVIDPDDSNLVYYEQPRGLIFRKNLSSGGAAQFTDGISLSDQNDRAAWSAPFIADPGNHDQFYCGRRSVYRRTSGTPWISISPRFRGVVSALAVSALDPGIIYAGSGIDAGASMLISNGVPLGELMVSTDGGRTWNERSSTSGLPNRAITDIAPSPRDTCTAYIAYSGFYCGHIFRTTDCGVTWTNVSAGLPDIPVNALAIDPANPATIYAGTDIGVYITTDGGATWASFGQGLPNVVVADMAIHAGSRTLRIATHGRSMWEIPLAATAPAAAITAPAGRESWMGRSPQSLAWSGFAGTVRVEYSIDGGTVFRTVAENVAANTYRWIVPDSPSADARIRVTEMTGAARSMTSRSFTIQPFKPGGVLASTLKALPCWGLAYDGEYLWATVENSDTLLELDPVTLGTVGIVKVMDGLSQRRFTGIAYHPGRKTFFIHDITAARPDGSGTALMYEVTKEGAVVHTWTSPCVYPTGLAWLGNLDGGRLIASDVFANQELYLIDPDNGSVTRTIQRATQIPFGPAGIAASDDGRTFWQVIENFDIATGPHGSSVARYSADDLAASCGFELAATPDSGIAGGYTGWGKLFARGVERDPADGNLWITNLDGAIYKFAACDADQSSVPSVRTMPVPAATFDAIGPNPLAGPARIGFRLPRAQYVTLELFDNGGRVVMMLAGGAFDAGHHEVMLDPATLASGIYHCRLTTADGSVLSRALMYLK